MLSKAGYGMSLQTPVLSVTVSCSERELNGFDRTAPAAHSRIHHSGQTL